MGIVFNIVMGDCVGYVILVIVVMLNFCKENVCGCVIYWWFWIIVNKCCCVCRICFDVINRYGLC